MADADIADRIWARDAALLRDTVREAGALALSLFRTELKNWIKGASSPVSEADIAVNDLVERRLRAATPDYGWLSEESVDDDSRLGKELVWIVDPIDGTRAFIMGSPMWGTLIGLLDEGQPVLGLINHPFTNERLWAGQQGAYYRIGDSRPQRLKTRACRALSQAVLASTDPQMFKTAKHQRVMKGLQERARLTRFGGDCYLYGLLAAGHLDLIVEAGLQAYDIAPIIPIIERAGGVVTAWDGGPATRGGNIVTAGDAKLHAEVLDLIKSF